MVGVGCEADKTFVDKIVGHPLNALAGDPQPPSDLRDRHGTTRYDTHELPPRLRLSFGACNGLSRATERPRGLVDVGNEQSHLARPIIDNMLSG